jgi:hypothetical protein
MKMVETSRKQSARGYSPELPRSSLAAMQPDSAIFAMAANRSCPGQIKIRPSAATGYPAISRVD